MSTKTRAKQLARFLQLQGIKNKRVLKAIATIPRHKFVPPELYEAAYDDNALPIGSGQTISQPFVVATMTEALLNEDEKLSRVLEIGTGSGYQAAILSCVADEVYTVERIKDLYDQSVQHLASYKNIYIKYDDGNLGWSEYAPFDGILVTAAAEMIPQDLLMQLKEGGHLIMPVGSPYSQTLVKATRVGDTFQTTTLEYVVFVPLLPGRG